MVNEKLPHEAMKPLALSPSGPKLGREARADVPGVLAERAADA